MNKNLRGSNLEPYMTEKETKATFEAIMLENFPTLMSDTKLQIWEAQKTPSKVNVKQTNKNFTYTYI